MLATGIVNCMVSLITIRILAITFSVQKESSLLQRSAEEDVA